MQWKSKLGISVFLCVLALLFALSAFAQARPMKSSGGISSGRSDTVHAEGAYVLREQDGYITVYSEASGIQSIEKTDIDVETLRSVDRDMLEQGIVAKTKDDLLCLLEDLGS